MSVKEHSQTSPEVRHGRKDVSSEQMSFMVCDGGRALEVDE